MSFRVLVHAYKLALLYGSGVKIRISLLGGITTQRLQTGTVMDLECKLGFILVMVCHKGQQEDASILKPHFLN